MVTDTSTMILITAIASAIMALYGAIAGVFFNGDEDDTESVAWYIALFIPIGVAIGVNIPWLDRGAEIFYGTINPVAGLILWYAPGLSVLISCALGWTISFLFFNRKRRPSIGTRRGKAKHWWSDTTPRSPR